MTLLEKMALSKNQIPRLKDDENVVLIELFHEHGM